MCPFCKNIARVQIRKDAVLLNFPLYCPRRKKGALIDVEKIHITLPKEPNT
ncbi:MAG: conjugal transfer protein [Oscillospiraceae bacterium]|nr:conjugal transfer protein [Oscillospiraceae bacterium]